MNDKILVVVPAYNEEMAIRQTLEELLSFRGQTPMDIIVIDDGSVDSTAEIVSQYPDIILISLPFNLGIGGAVQTGFLYALEHGYQIAVQFDADGQHNPQDIPLLVAPILQHEADVVIGSRFLQPRDGSYLSSPLRRAGIFIFKYLNSFIVRQRVTDNTSGFRAFNRSAIRLLARYYPHDYPEPEAVVFLGKNGMRIREVPVVMRPRRAGHSSILGGRAVFYMLKVLVALIFAALRPPIANPTYDDDKGGQA